MDNLHPYKGYHDVLTIHKILQEVKLMKCRYCETEVEKRNDKGICPMCAPIVLMKPKKDKTGRYKICHAPSKS